MDCGSDSNMASASVTLQLMSIVTMLFLLNSVMCLMSIYSQYTVGCAASFKPWVNFSCKFFGRLLADSGIHHSGMLVPAVLTATSHCYGNGQNSTPHRI